MQQINAAEVVTYSNVCPCIEEADLPFFQGGGQHGEDVQEPGGSGADDHTPARLLSGCEGSEVTRSICWPRSSTVIASRDPSTRGWQISCSFRPLPGWLMWNTHIRMPSLVVGSSDLRWTWLCSLHLRHPAVPDFGLIWNLPCRWFIHWRIFCRLQGQDLFCCFVSSIGTTVPVDASRSCNCWRMFVSPFWLFLTEQQVHKRERALCSISLGPVRH